MLRHLILLFCACLSMLSYGQDIRLGVPYGHVASVNKVLFSPDNQYALTSSEDGTMNIWRMSDGLLIYNIRNSNFGGTVTNDAEFSPDGKYMMTTSSDSTVKIYDFVKGELKFELKDDQAISKTTYSTDGRYILTSSKNCILWDANTGQKIRLITKSYSVLKGEFVPGSNYIVTSEGFNKKRVSVFDINGETYQQFKVYSEIFISPDGQHLVSSSYNAGIIGCWNVHTGKRLYRKFVHRQMIRDINFTPDGTSFATSAYVSKAKVFNTSSGKRIGVVNPRQYMVYISAISPDSKTLITYTNGKISKWDIQSGRLLGEIEGLRGEVLDIKYSNNGKYLIAGSESKTATVWNAESDETIHEFRSDLVELRKVSVSRDGKKVLLCFSSGNVQLYDPVKGKLTTTIYGKGKAKSAVVSPSGKYALVQLNSLLICIDIQTNKELYRVEGRLQHLSSDETKFLTLAGGRQLAVYRINDGSLLRKVQSPEYSRYAYFDDEMNYGITANDSYKGVGILMDLSTGKVKRRITNPYNKWRGVEIEDVASDFKYYILDPGVWNENFQLYDILSGKQIACLGLNNASLTKAWIAPDGLIYGLGDDQNIYVYSFEMAQASLHECLQPIRQFKLKGSISSDFALTEPMGVYSSDYSSIEIDPTNSDESYSISFFKNGDWICLSEDGFFDATPGAMEKMYWLQGKEVIDFDQLKHRYWIPGLAEKIMNAEPLPDVKSVGSIKLEPKVELGQVQDGQIPIKISKRAGGYGKVSLFINGKEVAENILPKDLDTSLNEQIVMFNVSGHRYLTSDTNYDNTIGVVAYSEDEFVQGRGVEVEYLFEDEERIQPHFYGVVLGVSDYVNENINLKYTTADAKAISTAIGLGAEELFKERTHLYTLHSEGDIRPTKEAIKRVFDTIAQQATADDIIFIYLSGHGVNYGGTYGDFYFLTADAISSRSEDYRDDYVRNTQAISTAEITEWLKDISALKQVMIIDACGSGKAVENLIASRSVESSQIKAIDRMKERTGMFIISGCAADAVSYEASRYGQGLLTYAILQAMKGAALRKNRFVDVNTIFTYARETVPELAGDIHGIQEPQLLMPSKGSFDIGILTADLQNLIPLNQPKPVFVRSMFLDQSSLEDVFMLSQKFDMALDEVSDKGDLSIMYLDVPNMDQGNRISGIYNQQDSIITLSYNIKMDNESHLGQISANSVDELIQILQEKVAELL